MKLLKMLHPRNLFLKKFALDHKAIKKALDHEYKVYPKIKSWFKGKQLTNKKLIIYSPGCGRDFASLLLIYDAIVSNENKEVEFIFQDFRDFYDGMLYELHKFTKGTWIVQHNSKGKHQATAYFKDKIFKMTYYATDISNSFPNELKSGYDIFYERAFEMFRSKNMMYAYRFYKNLNPSGLLISDYGFDFGSNKKNFKQLKGIPKYFGLYNNFQIWQKKKSTKSKSIVKKSSK